MHSLSGWRGWLKMSLYSGWPGWWFLPGPFLQKRCIHDSPRAHFGGKQTKNRRVIFVCQRKIFTTTTQHTQTPPEHGEHDNRHHSCSMEYTRRYMFKQCFLQDCYVVTLKKTLQTRIYRIYLIKISPTSHSQNSDPENDAISSGQWWSKKNLEKVWKSSKGIFPFNKHPFGPWGHRSFSGENFHLWDYS